MSSGKQGEKTEARIVLVTHPEPGAEVFAHRLVERRIAACVNSIAATSTFRWGGRIGQEPERLLIIKTAVGRLDDLRANLRSDHPYDVPECIVLDPEEVEPRYLAWLLAALRDDSAPGR